MAFTVEDGTRPVGANSYITEAFFRSHNGDRGRDALSSDIAQADVETACVRATDFADKRWGKRFRGHKSTSDQELQWPRLNAFDNANHWLNGVPKLLQKAIAEYAWITANLERDLAPPVATPFATSDPETGEITDAGNVLEKAEEIGPIVEKTKYGTPEKSAGPFTSTGNIVQSIPEYPEADLWVEELLTRRSGMLSRG